jgi:aspartyl-tRNA(Asn)/glutamyl-tRNA(Gln) amidotransferase subunit C
MSQSIDEATVRHVAYLARLELTDEEVERFTRQLAEILTYVHKLNELQTDDVSPTAHTLPVKSVFRNDTIEPARRHGDALYGAPDSQDGFFRVPKVLDQEAT